MYSKVLLCILACMLLSGCELFSSRLNEIGKAPELKPVEPPMRKKDYQPVRWPEEYDKMQKGDDDSQKYVNSLWSKSKKSFFAGSKSKKVGDIIKVSISINDKAELESETERERDDSNELDGSSIFGLERLLTGWLPGSVDRSSLLNISSSTTNSGTGTIEREEQIETEIAAMITQILPNGNLFINGDQQIRVNHEVRNITVSGIINPSDIASDNSIDSNMIAEARISYGGKGTISDVQQPRYGQQVIEALSPF
ncbi:MAG: flagellar basal body L-ring protein FlgH [Rickettsiales bacterium]|nr:flagellar basal body L-ring protein FlgH [Rickettsiales bacterium]